jgi:anti-sigma regulatory factor (Ser/Thr protein kinase)
VGSVGGQFQREISALEEVFALLDAFVASQTIGEKTSFTLRVVVEELFTNMIRHNVGGAETIDLAIDRVGNRVLLELVDTDVEPFDPETAEVPRVDADIAERRPGGLGIYLVKKMVDELRYDYDTEERRMRVSAAMTLES